MSRFSFRATNGKEVLSAEEVANKDWYLGADGKLYEHEMGYGCCDGCTILEVKGWKPLFSTGLLDSKGVEIFCGDVVKDIISNVVYEIKWYNSVLADSIDIKEDLTIVAGFGFESTNADECTIIGNKYSNPELLAKTA